MTRASRSILAGTRPEGDWRIAGLVYGANWPRDCTFAQMGAVPRSARINVSNLTAFFRGMGGHMRETPAQTTVARHLVLVFALTAAWAGSAVAQPVPPFDGAESFVVLADSTVTNTGAVDLRRRHRRRRGRLDHWRVAGDAHRRQRATQRRRSRRPGAPQRQPTVYTDLAARTCVAANTDQPLGATLASGTHCFTGDLTVGAALQLIGPGPWIILVNGALTVAPGVAITAPIVAPDTCGGSPVYWQVAYLRRSVRGIGWRRRRGGRQHHRRRADDVCDRCDSRRPRSVAGQCRRHLRRHGDARRHDRVAPAVTARRCRPTPLSRSPAAAGSTSPTTRP